MRLYNATPDQQIGKCHGISYLFEPGTYKDLTDDVGAWILERWKVYGLVDITVKEIKKSESLKTFLVTKTLEGLHSYLQTQHDALEGCINFDTEMKTQNVYGTILKSKPVTKITHKIEQLTRLIAEMEAKYGIKIAEQEYAEKSSVLLNSVESLVTMFEADAENQKKATVQEAKMNQIIKEMLPEISVA